ncbi:unnamed protein product [Protopolystoma xenopodis]|uniref:Uncharacterized protein n=1 Tax=Protopolystoma xenopodis TaxID=117903 RepID=A0A448WAE2_9PLAT|nr:unnamed protein product [Protopolystoma xenopodis]
MRVQRCNLRDLSALKVTITQLSGETEATWSIEQRAYLRAQMAWFLNPLGAVPKHKRDRGCTRLSKKGIFNAGQSQTAWPSKHSVRSVAAA